MKSLPSRSAVLVTIALAVVVGGTGGLLAGLAAGPLGTADPAPPAGDAAAEDPNAQRSRRSRSERRSTTSRGERSRSRAAREGTVTVRTPRRGGTTDRAELSRRIASPDPDVRYGAALDLMLPGPQSLSTLRALDPATDEARAYVAKLIDALDVLERQQRSKPWSTLPVDRRLELELDALRAGVPDDYLAAQRERYWAAKSSADRVRAEAGDVEVGELRFAEAQLATARMELGHMSAAAAAAEIAPHLDTIRKWVASVRQSNRFVGSRWIELSEQLASLERL